MISLHNFFILCFQCMPPPRLADYLKTAARIKMLKDEQMRLKLKLAQAGYDEDLNLSSGNIKYFEAPPSQEIMDDFFLIAQEAGKTDNQVKSIKSFLKTITGNRSTKPPSSQPVISRVKPTNLSVSKTPLKRISQASAKPSNLSSTSTTSNTSLEKQEAKEDQVDQLSQDQDDLSEKSEKDFESNLLMTPATPGSRYLLLGQEEYNEHRSTVCALQVSPSGLVATADVSGVVKVWSTGASMHPSTISTFISASPVSCLVWLDDRKLIYGTHMGQVRLCDVEDKCLVMETACNKLTGQPISALASRPSGSSFFVCSAGKALIINSKEIRNFSVEVELVDPALTGVSAAHFNHNGALLVFATNKGKVGIMDLNRNEILATWSGHQKGVIGLELSLDETSVWSLGREGTLLQSSLLRPGDKVWSGDVSTKDGFTGDFALSPDGEHILYGSDEGAVIYRIGDQDGEMTRVLGIRGVTPITSVHWSSVPPIISKGGHKIPISCWDGWFAKDIYSATAVNKTL
ncbi:WD repeat-containing protein 91 [Eurytemora carolleeae]|uniref:WD repeat-containing protein 91 n=1 Tax=Eurytemora carolleeae TaxID=1294199 RepID=UPI000C788136|nr:WD repeat-containing protein 91 [Eurytemora carolleeae]|eukprot:XP_023342348.1 WD repeat-containing protein 91-like [Eurytemora affinis]